MPDFSQLDVWQFLAENLSAIGPQLHLIIWGLGLLCADVFLPPQRKVWAVFFALGGLTASSYHLLNSWGVSVGSAFYGTVTLDSFSLFFDLLFLVSGFIVVFLSYRYLEIEQEQHSEYYALLLFSLSGMMFLASAIELVTIFISLELMSISTYVLVGFLRRQRRSNEASLKYFLVGAFSTGIILYGMSLLYGVTGSTNLYEISRHTAQLGSNPLFLLALFLMTVGLLFKVAAAPFHMWVPDAYEGAPTAITGFMSVAVKAAAFAVFFRIFYLVFLDLREVYLVALVLVAILTMTWGNVAAVTQENVKRMLAYSSVSHAGFVLMGLVAGTSFGVTASAIYLLAYTFMNLGTWAIVILLRRQDIVGEQVEDFNGLFFKHPALAVLMLVFLLSLAGIPPLGGFIAKYFVFAAVLEEALRPANPFAFWLVVLAVAGALNAVVSLYYYFRLVLAMFIRREFLPAPLGFSVGVVISLVIAGLFTVLIGVYPNPFVELARTASLPFL